MCFNLCNRCGHCCGNNFGFNNGCCRNHCCRDDYYREYTTFREVAHGHPYHEFRHSSPFNFDSHNNCGCCHDRCGFNRFDGNKFGFNDCGRSSFIK